MSKYITCYDLDEEGKPILHKPFFMRVSNEIWQNILQNMKDTIPNGMRESLNWKI